MSNGWRSVDRVHGFVAKCLKESGKVSRCVVSNDGEPFSTQTAGGDGERAVFAVSKMGLEGPSRQDRYPKAGLNELQDRFGKRDFIDRFWPDPGCTQHSQEDRTPGKRRIGEEGFAAKILRPQILSICQ